MRQISESAQNNFSLNGQRANNNENYYQEHHPTNLVYEPSTPVFPNQQRMSR